MTTPDKKLDELAALLTALKPQELREIARLYELRIQPPEPAQMPFAACYVFDSVLITAAHERN